MIKTSLFLLLLLPLPLMASHPATEGENELKLKAFSTDGCSRTPDGPKDDKYKWVHCCIAHDIQYWIGGSEDRRDQVDQDLMSCVSKTTESDFLGKIFKMGVLAGGSRIFKTTFRWGYGWPYDFRKSLRDRYGHPTDYSPLRTVHLQKAQKKLPQALTVINDIDYLKPGQMDYILDEYNFIVDLIDFELK